jgi:hypothetical protein
VPHAASNGVIPTLLELFKPLGGELVHLPSYEQMLHRLVSARDQFNAFANPHVTSNKVVVVAGKKHDRGAWQGIANTTISKWVSALERNEFNTFKQLGSYQSCKNQLIEQLKSVQTSVGPISGPMNRQAIIAFGRDISDTLLIHLLRRRSAKGQQPRQPPLTLAELDYNDGGGADPKKAWFHRSLQLIESDIKKRPLPGWLSSGPWSNTSLRNLGRLCNLLRQLHVDSNDAHHGATSAGLGETLFTPDDVNRILIQPLDELFCKDTTRMPRDRQQRVLV